MRSKQQRRAPPLGLVSGNPAARSATQRCFRIEEEESTGPPSDRDVRLQKIISGAQGVSLPCWLVARSSKQEQTCNCSALGAAGHENTRQEGLQDLGRACRWRLGGSPLFLTGASLGNVPHRDSWEYLTPAFAQGFLCLAVVCLRVDRCPGTRGHSQVRVCVEGWRAGRPNQEDPLDSRACR